MAADYRNMTVEALRKLARRVLGPGQARLGTRAALIAALEAADGAADPEGHLVARVAGEEAVRQAPHPLGEGASDTGERVPEGFPAAPPGDEGLGELPWSYAEDELAALARDPSTLFVFWDHAPATVRRGLEGLAHARVQLWLFAQAGDGWERLRAVDVVLESRGHYLHDLEPGRTYRAELWALGQGGVERRLGPGARPVRLPWAGPSPVVEDLFLELPWSAPLGAPLGPGHRGPDLPAADREELARLSAWPRPGAWAGSPGSPRPGSPSAPAPGTRGGER